MHIEIDLTDVRSKEEFHDKIQEELDCPNYYGRNMDALYDVLTAYCEPVELDFIGFVDFAQDLPGYGSAFKEMCLEAMAENHELTIYFDGEVVEEE